VTDADKAFGKQVQEEAAQELIQRQGHQLVFIVVGGVAPTKGDGVVDQGNQALVGDGDTMGVVTEVA